MKFAVWKPRVPKKPSYWDTPAPNWSWLRFCSSNFIVTSILLSNPGASLTSTSLPPSSVLK